MNLDYRNPKLVLATKEDLQGECTWESPSNLALVKYWGKTGRQLPRNPSISITLSSALTKTTLAYRPRSGPSGEIELELFLDDTPRPDFASRIRAYFAGIQDIYPFLGQLAWTVRTSNSFPHSSGIASSASAMSALALCLCSLEDGFFGTLADQVAFDRKASYLSRLGSGSACRSIYPFMAEWGRHGDIAGSSDEFAVPFGDRLHPSFRTLRNAILIVSSGSKSVSSSAGHNLMENHPYASARYIQAGVQLSRLIPALEQGDWETFGLITENEALTLHALMMASNPSYILMKPESLELISTIRRFREESGIPVYFSLDAGPNLHVLYPEEAAERVESFLHEQCLPLCEDRRWIPDACGPGPREI